MDTTPCVPEKFFHGGIDDTDAWTEGGEKRQFSDPINTAPPSYVTEEDMRIRQVPKLTPGAGTNPHSDHWEAVVGDSVALLGDTKVGDKAIEYIRRSKQTGKPFFIACGFSKPHSPSCCPQRIF